MKDIFDSKIICRECNTEMKQGTVHKEGMELRAVICPKCNERIIHPEDLNSLKHFDNLRDKTFVVKLRVVGNSHAISIPKEIVDFMNEQQKFMNKRMDDMVKLCFEDFDTLKVRFGDEE